MSRIDPAWLEVQYNNRARVPDHVQVFERWREASALARSASSCRIDVAYGPGPGETLDVFPSARAHAPVLVFIHGGWWRSLDKRDHSFVAPVFAQAGALVVMPNYDLCPGVTIATIALQMARALAWTYRHAALYGGDPKRIVVAGHSAGGHLAAMMLSCDWRSWGRGLPAQLVRSALSVSGLFDLAPLRHTPSLQADFRLTPRDVKRLSPVVFPAPRGRPLYAVVGEQESEEFLRQTHAIRQSWGARAVPVCATVPDANHFDILHQLVNPQAQLHGLALELLGLDGLPSRPPLEHSA